jgi:aspartate/methionine/tyrosine aminotransferase
MLEEFRIRRRLVVERLNETPGIRCRRPAGAFYAFPNVSALPLSADEFASRLLEESGVALLAGSAFGQIGRDNLRVSYANSQAALDRALDRITDFVDALG